MANNISEAYQLAMYVLDQYRGTSVSCRYKIPPRFAAPEANLDLVCAVENAVADVVLKHPMLQVGIKDADSKNPTWIQLNNIDLSRHITWVVLNSSQGFDDTSQETTMSEIDGIFPELESRPGWRVVVVHQESTGLLEIHFTWNHPHADGISGKIFQGNLCQSLNNQRRIGQNIRESSSSSKILTAKASTQLPPSIEDTCKLPVALSYIMKMIWEELGPAKLVWTRPSLARWAPFQLSPYKTQFRAFSINNETLDRILFSCRRNKTSLTGLLHGLTLVSLASHVDEEAASAFEGGTTVDMRRFMTSNPPGYLWLQPEKTMSNYVTLMAHKFDRSVVNGIRLELSSNTNDNGTVSLSAKLMEQMWSVSTKVRDEITQKIEGGLKNDPVGVMKFVGDWRKQMTDAAQRPRQFSWWVTGIGVLDERAMPTDTTTSLSPGAPASSSETWAIHRAQFALSAETTAAAFMISPMTAAGEQLCVGVSWQDSICDVSLGERIVADLDLWLNQIASLCDGFSA